MTEILTVRLPEKLAKEFKAKAKLSKSNASAVLRRFASEYVRGGKKTSGNALQEHIAARAGSWDGYCSGEELLRRTRP